MKNLLPLLIAFSIGIIACKTKNEVSSSKSANENKTEPASEEQVVMEDVQQKSSINNKYWKAVEIMGEPVEMPEGMSQEPYIKLNEMGEISGHGGCNSFFGKFKLEGKNFIQFSDFGMSEMECQYESYDQKLMEALNMTRQYTTRGEDEMQLIVGKRAPLAVFKAVYME